MRLRTTGICVALMALWSGWAGVARADGGLADLELTVPLGLMDRASTGTGPELAGFGYDDQSGLSLGGEARLYVDMGNRYWNLGVVAGATHHAGPLLGLADGHAFRTTMVDAGITGRVLFPCMSSEELRWMMSGLLAMTGVHADAGTGVGGQDNGPRWDERSAAAEGLDHAGLGWRFALDLSAHLSNFVIGLGLGVRQYFGIDAAVSRGWLMDVGLRIGGRVDFDGRHEPYGV